MKMPDASKLGAAALVAMLLAACERGQTPAANGVIQTKYPGQVSAGGMTSGQIMARTARDTTDAIYAGGTPGIAGGSGGNTSGAAIGGATRETGQGPSSGVTAPSGTGQLGGTLQEGDSKPAEPSPAAREQGPANNAAPQGPAAPGRVEGQR